jgi:Uma2 family endonuclease
MAMSAPAATSLMTTEEFLALPDNGVERWLIRGQLREKPMTMGNRWHSRIMIRIGQLLSNWVDQQPEPRGEVLGGEAGCRLRRNPDTNVGIDVAYISPQLAAQDPDDTTLIDGVPTLVVEILSPNDTQEEINEKVDEYLAAGVALVWLVDPHHRTVEVHRSGGEPELFNVRQELSAEPHLPGFRVPVAHIFSR